MSSKSTLSGLGSIMLSFLGSACGPLCFLTGCCGGTAVLGFIGLSGATLGFISKLTPLFLALTVLSLGYGFYVAYRPKRETCCENSSETSPASCCKPVQKTSFFRSKTFLWVSTILCIVLWTYPLVQNKKNSEPVSGSCCPAVDTTHKTCCPAKADTTVKTNTKSINSNSCCPN